MLAPTEAPCPLLSQRLSVIVPPAAVSMPSPVLKRAVQFLTAHPNCTWKPSPALLVAVHPVSLQASTQWKPWELRAVALQFTRASPLPTLYADATRASPLLVTVHESRRFPLRLLKKPSPSLLRDVQPRAMEPRRTSMPTSQLMAEQFVAMQPSFRLNPASVHAWAEHESAVPPVDSRKPLAHALATQPWALAPVKT